MAPSRRALVSGACFVLLAGWAAVTTLSSPRGAAARRQLLASPWPSAASSTLGLGDDGLSLLLGLPGDGEESFKRWMENAGLGIDDDEPLHSLKSKVIHRFLLFCHDVLPPHLLDQYRQEIADIGIDWIGSTRKLTAAEELVRFVVSASGEDVKKGLGDPSSYNFFGFVPQPQGRSIPGTKALTWETPCWGAVAAETVAVSDGWEMSVKVSGHKKLLCADFYLFTTASGVQFGAFPTPIPGTKTFKFHSAHLSESEVWDVNTNGIRVFRFRDGPLGLVRDLFETALMFVPLVINPPPAWVKTHTLDFMKKYVGREMKPRADDPQRLMLNASEINSGDFLGIIRLDGLDPMLAWAMGSGTGHTVVAMRENGQLYIAESQAKGAYWSTNGIQRTPYEEWIALARKAGYSVVHAPLAEKYRKMFDDEAANRFFHSQEGLDYGYAALLVGWLDTINDNYPCLPPYIGADKYCLSWELIETLFPLLRKYLKAVDKIYLESWNQHVMGNSSAGLEPTQLYQEAAKRQMPLESIVTVVEKDETHYAQIYNNGTKTRGQSMVCDVFVCFVWKAAGLFKDIGNEINCVEQTNLDVYWLKILTKPNPRPPQCVAADPDNELCQLMGSNELTLPKVGTHDSYTHMNEHCPSMAPEYKRPAHC